VTNVMEEPAVELPLLTDPWTDQRQTRASLSRMSTQVSTTLVSNLNGLSWDQWCLPRYREWMYSRVSTTAGQLFVARVV